MTTGKRLHRLADVVVPLPWTKPPLSQNDRQHHHVKAKLVSAALGEARQAIRTRGLPPVAGANVTLHYRVADKRRRDADNLAVVLKVCLDALVAEGVLPDDSWVHCPHAGMTIHPPNGEPASMWLTLETP